jgi:hypothetical protein
MIQTMIKIRQNLKISQDKQKSYADNKRTHKELYVGDHVYLRVKPKRSSLWMGTCAKLAPQYCRQFEVLERVGSITYRFDLPLTVRSHNVFHVSLLKKYVHDSNHVIDWIVIQMELEG